jgi:hypothetical protein
MPDDELLERVRELRSRGRSPKEIARALKVRPATVTPLIQRLAAAEAQKEAPLVGCWVNQGWSSSVRFTGHPEWPDTGAGETGASGLVIVVVARERGSSVRVCEFLVDTWCLGVKNALGPKPVERRRLPSFRADAFRSYPGRRRHHPGRPGSGLVKAVTVSPLAGDDVAQSRALPGCRRVR